MVGVSKKPTPYRSSTQRRECAQNNSDNGKRRKRWQMIMTDDLLGSQRWRAGRPAKPHHRQVCVLTVSSGSYIIAQSYANETSRGRRWSHLQAFLRVARARGRRPWPRHALFTEQTYRNRSKLCLVSWDKALHGGFASGQLAFVHIEPGLSTLVLAAKPSITVRPGLCRTSTLHLI